ncbi:MAG: hypothetical protein DIU76_08285 [Bacillota bacterium]|nr:MAG: hypothetical protein DIU76_08285 [Bacillota bacterium]
MITLKPGGTRPAPEATLKSNGAPVDLSGASVRFVMVGQGLTIDRQAEIVDAASGVVRVVFEPGDTDTPGQYHAEFEATYSDGRKETYPSHGYLTVQILPDLG